MKAQDLTFKTEHGRFNYRVGAIIINNNKLLMVKNKNAPYYYSVGGRVKINETAEEAVIREVFEETGIIFEINRLAFIHENFFIEEVTKEPFHEISFFYIMKQNKSINLVCNSFTEDGISESLEWLSMEHLDNIHLFPQFFKTKLLKLNDGIEHIVTEEYQRKV